MNGDFRSSWLCTARQAVLPLAVLCLALLLGACAAGGPGLGSRLPTRPKPQPAPVSEPTAPVPAPEAPAPQAAPALPPVDVKHTLDQVRQHLSAGDESQALGELKRVLDAEPENKTAQSFMRQIQDDPKQIYGRASQPYKVSAGDTLALLAQRALSDRDQFYGLARYNGLKVPNDLKLGQTIQIPGTRRLTPAPPALTGATGVSTGDDHKATAEKKPADDRAAADKAAADERAAAEKKRKAEEAAAAGRTSELARLMGGARAAMRRQDVCGGIKQFDAVLKLDPDHASAQFERTRAVELRSKLGAKC